jgi:hypothetical protein
MEKILKDDVRICSLAPKILSTIFFELLNEFEYTNWDIAHCNHTDRNILMATVAYWGASSWDCVFQLDIIRDQSSAKSFVKWLVSRRFLKHRNITIQCLESRDILSEILSELEFEETRNLHLVAFRGNTGTEDHHHCNLGTNLALFKNLHELRFENCINLTDMKLNRMQKTLKKIKSFLIFSCFQSDDSKRFELLDFFLNFNLEEFQINGNFNLADGPKNNRVGFIREIANTFISKRPSLKVLNYGDLDVLVDQSFFAVCANSSLVFFETFNPQVFDLRLINTFLSSRVENFAFKLSYVYKHKCVKTLEFDYIHSLLSTLLTLSDRKYNVRFPSNLSVHNHCSMGGCGSQDGLFSVHQITLDCKMLDIDTLNFIEQFCSQNLEIILLVNCDFICSLEELRSMTTKCCALKQLKLSGGKLSDDAQLREFLVSSGFQ